MKKIVFLFLVVLFTFALANSLFAAEEKGLEITYPEIPGIPTPKYVTTGLPEYVNYIFRLAIIIIGFIILGALIYAGVNYLLSFGNPAKLTDAKEGIFSAFLGAIILLSAWLIFNTINPQLVIFEVKPVLVITPRVTPGAYICNYRLENIGSLLDSYMHGTDEEKIAAVKELKEKMGKAGDRKFCVRAKYSDLLKDFTLTKDFTLFIVPEARRGSWVFKSGIIFYDKNYLGEYMFGDHYCKIFPEPSGGTLYKQVDNFFPDLGFEAKAYTVFDKLESEPRPDAPGVTLYECKNFNETAAKMCPPGVTTPISKSFSTAGADIRGVKREELRVGQRPCPEDPTQTCEATLAENTFSIGIDPAGSYFALIYEIDNFGPGKCGIIKREVSNIVPKTIGQCGNCEIVAYLRDPFVSDCHPCINSMYVIKGQAK